MAAWTKEQILARIDEEERKAGLPRGLGRAVATQESDLTVNAVGDNGKSLGLFQLQPAAALDVGVNPQWRQDPDVNIYGGIRYLKKKLDQSKGNVEEALRRYNGGGDPNYVQNVLRFFKPGVAEASERPQAGTYTDTDVQQALQALQGTTTPQAPAGGTYSDEDVQQALQALQGTQMPAAAPAPPTARSTPEQDAAYRQWAAQQGAEGMQPPAPGSQTTPAPPTRPGGNQVPATGTMERFNALPAIQQLTPAERQARTREFAALRPDLQEEFLRSEEPPSQLTVDIEKPSTPQAVPRPPGRNPYLPPGVPSIEEETLQEGITRPSTMIPLLMGGTGIKAVTRALGEVPTVVGRLARPVAEGLSQTLGWGAGRTAETGQVPSAGELGTDAALNIAVGGVFEGLHAGVQSMLRRSQAGRAIAQADDATRTAYQEWQTAAAEARAQQQAGRAEAYQTAERKARDAQARYQAKVQAREQTIQANEQTYRDALQQYDQEVTAARTQGYRQTEQELAQQQRTYQGQVGQQAADVAAQQQAVQTARAVPGRYTPETPSWVLYEKFGEAAKDATVDLTPAKAALAEVRASRGVLPDGTVRPLPAAVESMAANLEKATGETSLQTIREELRRLGPLTRSSDSNVRGAAKQLYGIYADVLEASPVANDLLRQANATFRKEMALQDVQEWLRPGHGVVRIDQQGRETINVGALLTRLEKQVGDDALFARSFGPDDLQGMRQDFGRLAGTPKMPTSGVRAPQPALLPGSAPDLPARLQTPPTPPGTPAEVPRPRQELLPGGAGPGRRMPDVSPEPVPVTPRQALGERPKFLGPRAGEWGAILATLQAMGVPTAPLAVAAGVHVTQRQARWLMAHALLDPKRRAVMQAALDGQMRLNPRVYGALVATLSPEEKTAYQRETRVQGR